MGAALDKLSTVSSNSSLYLQELSGFAVKESIPTKNSRFLRTVECICEEGRAVVKVYARRGEPPELLQKEKARLEALAGTFAMVKNSNLLPYSKVILNERAAFLVRQYLANNLCERMGSRPFFTDLEKRWILFQLLKALDQCHHWGIAHGDLTTENVLLTTWNWVYLSDFSPFKPAYLPLEDPSDFTFFFNSSGRTAYLAPERFYSLSDGSQRPEYTPCSDLKPSADVFSFGCVAAELFLESELPLFDFSQLLAYRKGEYNVEETIATIKDPWIQSLVRQCTQLNPENRISIQAALQEWPDKSFHTLHAYCSDHIMPCDPDHRISRLQTDFDQLVELVNCPNSLAPEIWKSNQRPRSGLPATMNAGNRRSIQTTRADNDACTPLAALAPGEAMGVLAEAHTLMGPMSAEELVAAAREIEENAHAALPIEEVALVEHPLGMDDPEPDFSRLAVPTSSDSFIKSVEEHSLTEDEACSSATADLNCLLAPSGAPMVTMLSVVFSSIRNVRTPTAKIAAVKLLGRFAEILDDESRLQRIVPFMFAVLPHSEDKPLVRASVIRGLEKVLRLVQVGEPHVFQTYIIPGIAGFSKDPDETVREAMASCLASLATSARRLSETVMTVDVGFDGILYELRKSFHSMVRDLLEDNSMAVKRRILMSLTPLCLFFGRRVSTETFVPFVLTFLSHPQWQLRVAAYHHLLGVMSIVGSKSLEDITLALISKTFADQEEFVIDRAVLCVVSLVKAGMLRKKVVFDLAAQAAPLLLHPSKWVRNAALELEQVVWDSLSPADRFVFFCPFITPFLSNVLSPVLDSSAITKLLKSPVRRHDLTVALVVAHDFYRKGSFVDTPGFSGLLTSRLKQNNIEDVTLGRILLMASWMQSHAEGNAEKNNAAAGSEAPGVSGEIVIDGIMAGASAKVVPTRGTLEAPIVLPRVNVVAIDRDRRASSLGLGVGSSGDESTFTEEEFRRRFSHISLRQSQGGQNGGGLNMSLSAALDPHAYDLSKSDSAAGASSPSTPQSTLNASTSAIGSSLASSGLGLGTSPASLSTSTGGSNNTSSPGGNPSGGDTTSDRMHLNVSLDPTQDELGPGLGGGIGVGMGNFGTAGSVTGVGAMIAQGGDTSKILSGWRPKGTLVAHLHEHAAAVTQLAVSDDHRFFVSGSLDGTVKVWDCERLHTVVTNRSRLTCKLQRGKINSLAMIRHSHSVASACDEGSVHIFNIEHQRRVEKSFAKTVYTGVQTVRLIDRHEGSVFDVRHQDVGPSSVLMYSTLRGNIHGWDLRMKNASQESFIMRNAPSLGLLTSVEVDRHSNWVIVGTDLGVYTIWDMRFQIPVRSFSHPTQAGVMRMRTVSSYQKNANCVFSANSNNTVTLWDVEANRGRLVCRINGIRKTSPAANSNSSSSAATGGPNIFSPPPLKNARGYRSPEGVAASSVPAARASMDRLVTTKSSVFSSTSLSASGTISGSSKSRESMSGLKSVDSVSDLSDMTASTANFPREPPCIRSLLPGPDSQFLITGSTDCKIRFWDLQRPAESYIVSGALKDQKTTFSSNLQEDVHVMQESTSVLSGNTGNRSMNPGLAVASSGHRDAITDLKAVYSTTNMLLSADRTGVIKVWL